MEYKKGQVTIFIIIAVLIVAMAALFFVFRDKPVEETVFLEAEPIRNYVVACLDSFVEEGIYFLGLQGGYYNVPEPSERYLYIDVPVYLEYDSVNVPSIERVESELVDYVSEALPFCLDGLDEFREGGFEIEEGEFSGNAFVGERIVFDLDYPLTIRKGDQVSSIRSFESRLEFDFISKYEIANNISEFHAEIPGWLDIWHITKSGMENDFFAEYLELESDLRVVSMVFEEFDRDGNPFIYAFVMDHRER